MGLLIGGSQCICLKIEKKIFQVVSGSVKTNGKSPTDFNFDLNFNPIFFMDQ